MANDDKLHKLNLLRVEIIFLLEIHPLHCVEQSLFAHQIRAFKYSYFKQSSTYVQYFYRFHEFYCWTAGAATFDNNQITTSTVQTFT